VLLSLYLKEAIEFVEKNLFYEIILNVLQVYFDYLLVLFEYLLLKFLKYLIQEFQIVVDLIYPYVYFVEIHPNL